MKNMKVMTQTIILGSLVGCGEPLGPAESTEVAFRQDFESAVNAAKVRCALHVTNNRADCNFCAQLVADRMVQIGSISDQQRGALIQAVAQDACRLMPFCAEPDFYQPSGPHLISCGCFDEQGQSIEFCGDDEDCTRLDTLCENLCGACPPEDDDIGPRCFQDRIECSPE